ncbi:MAG: High-affinity branched-chain amino acid transport ATP-binding protein LivF [Syntrophomonadaceae bacterium]|nr:High-affinity branched-chain amino acid transport ATP-binding protein LivF [Bacillota bacterium]
MKPVLKLENISSFIGPFHILQGVSLEVRPGEAVVVLGRNGAGKTTTLRSIMGLVKPAAGVLELEDQSLFGLPSHKIARLGLGYVPEDYGIFNLLSVEENLRLAAWRQDNATKERQEYILQLFPDLKAAYRRLASTLSGGQRQMLSIGRALLNENKVILIDEPSKGLAPIVVEKVCKALLEVKKNTNIILVEQNFNLACAVGDRFYILNDGRTVLDGGIASLAKDRELQKRYLGVVA